MSFVLWDRSHDDVGAIPRTRGLMAVTLDEIAELAGVGRSTVSRVLNNDPRVRDATRERILEIVRRENYQPNFAARSLASGRSDVIGAVVPMALPSVFTDPFFPQFLEGVSAARAAGDGASQGRQGRELWAGRRADHRRTRQRRSVRRGVARRQEAVRSLWP